MTELFELVDRAPRAAPLGVAEALVPMLDDLARAFGCDHGLILVYDDRRRSLRGVSGHDMRPELVDSVEKEWLWWMINALDDPVVVMDENNEIVFHNVRAELLFRAHDDDSEGRRHAVWMNNFLFTAALSSWKLEPAGPVAAREATLVDP